MSGLQGGGESQTFHLQLTRRKRIEDFYSQLDQESRLGRKKKKSSLVGAKERRTGVGWALVPWQTERASRAGSGMGVAFGNPRTAYSPTHPLILPPILSPPTTLVTEQVTAYTQRSHIWPLILKKPIKTAKLIVKSRRGGLFNMAILER